MADADVRLSWKLPLLGSAEMNRLQPIRAGRFTSRPYPVLMQDGFQAYVTRADTSSMVSEERFQASAVLVGGLMTSGYQLYVVPVEPFQAVPSLLSGTLEVTTSYGAYSVPAETFRAGVVLQAGTLEVTTQYVQYPRWAPDSFSAQPTLVGGTLA